MRKPFVRNEDGQAMIEFALIAPMLLLMLCGIVYCGGLVLLQENLAVTARHVARSSALEGTKSALSSRRGGLSSEEARSKALREATGGGRSFGINGVRWGGVGVSGLKSINAHTAIYKATFPVNYGGGTAQGGVGVLFHGVTITKDITRDLSPIGKLASRLGGGLSGLTGGNLTASSIMPAELPPRGPKGTGVLDVNEWITQIVDAPIK